MKHKVSAGLGAMLIAAASLNCFPALTAFAAGGAGGYSWIKTVGYQEGTDSVTDGDNKTVVTFTNADNDKKVAGFCTESGDGWDWSDYTQLSLSVTNDSQSDISFALALGTGSDWNWYQSTNEAKIAPGKTAELSYYLNSDEWTFDGTVSAPADLYAVHRISGMVMPAQEGTTVSGSVTLSAMSLGGSAAATVEPKDGFYVDGATLRDANQNPFVMRGTNYAYTWYSWDGKTEAAMKEIAGYGANAVRIVLGDGDQYTKNTAGEIANLIKICEQEKLVAIFEVHDATGKDDAQPLLNAAKYFANDLASVLKGHEDTVIINIANEWQGSANDSAWVSAYKDAVKIIRDAGLQHCIMCDAGGWGQSASTVINGGAAVLAADPEHNTMFSVHMYGTAGGKQSTIKSTIDSMITRGLCLVIGEFGYTHSDGDVDEGYIMSYSQETNTGWLAWSWYGNGSPVEYLDMSSANAGGTLSKDWGEVVINGKNGWKETAKPCSVFDGTVTTTTTTTITTTTNTTTTTTTTTMTDPTVTTTTTTVTTIVPGPKKAHLNINEITLKIGEEVTVIATPEGSEKALDIYNVLADDYTLVEKENYGNKCVISGRLPGVCKVTINLSNADFVLDNKVVTVTVLPPDSTVTVGVVKKGEDEQPVEKTIKVGETIEFCADMTGMSDSVSFAVVNSALSVAQATPADKKCVLLGLEPGTTTVRILMDDNGTSYVSTLELTVVEASDTDDVLLGDVNCDGQRNVADAVLMARVAAGDKTVKVTNQGRKNADVNGDEIVTSDDLTRFLLFLGKKLEAL